MGFYEGQDGPAVVKSAKSGTNGFKKGGKVFSEAAKGKKPARATGGGVFSSAHSGSPRGATPKPY